MKPYQRLLKMNLTYMAIGGHSGKERVKNFLLKEVGRGNYFHPEEFKPYARNFGLSPASISSTFDTLKGEGVVENFGSGGKNVRQPKIWRVK